MQPSNVTKCTILYVQFKDSSQFFERADLILSGPCILRSRLTPTHKGLYVELVPPADQRTVESNLLMFEDILKRECADEIEPVGDQLYRLIEPEEIEKRHGMKWTEFFSPQATA